MGLHHRRREKPLRELLALLLRLLPAASEAGAEVARHLLRPGRFVAVSARVADELVAGGSHVDAAARAKAAGAPAGALALRNLVHRKHHLRRARPGAIERVVLVVDTSAARGMGGPAHGWACRRASAAARDQMRGWRPPLWRKVGCPQATV